MNRGKITNFGMVLVVLLSILALSGSVSALNAAIDTVKLDGDEVLPGLNTLQDLERDNSFEVKVKVTAFEDIDNVEIEAMMSGYDHNDRVSDVTEVFDMKANVSYVKKLELKVPPRMDVDTYKLRIYVRDRAGDEMQNDYMLYVDTVRHSILIKSVDVDPASQVEAGRSVRVLAHLKNYGQLDEDDVKVEVAIPELGVSALPDYLSIESGETKTSEELYMRIPLCAEEGQYAGEVKVTYHDGDEVETQSFVMNVAQTGACEVAKPADKETPEEEKPVKPAEKTIITVGAQNQDVTRGEGGAIFPVTFTNSGSESKTYVLSVSGADEWATVKMSPLQTVTVAGGESKSVYVYVSAKDTAELGEKAFNVEVKDASGTVLKQLGMTANVVEPEGAKESGSSLKKALEIGLIVLVVILIVVALIVVFTRKKEDEEEEAEDEISGQTYY